MNSAPAWTYKHVRRFLAGYGIDVGQISVSPLEGGCDNLNLLVTVDDRHAVIRRYSHTPTDEVEWELRLVRHLCERGFPTPAVLSALDGALQRDFVCRPAALFTFVPGREPSPQSPRDAAQVAAGIAELHLHTRDLQFPHARSHTDWKRLADLDEVASALRAPGLAEMAKQAEAFRVEFAQRLGPRTHILPDGIVHHDANPGNALLHDDGTLAAIIDFDEAHEGELLTDVAGLLRLWATPRKWQGLRAGMVDAILSAYDARRPLTPVEWEVLPLYLLLYTLADAAGYVTRRLTSDPAAPAVAECRAYRRFLELSRDRTWAEALMPQR